MFPAFAAVFAAGEGTKVNCSLLRIRIDRQSLTRNHFAVEQLHGERVLDEPLDGALQRPRPELRIVPLAEEQFVRFLRQRDLDLALGRACRRRF